MTDKGIGLLSIWWILVLALTGAGIVIGVSIFANSDIYVKEIESQILAHRAVDCIAPLGLMNGNVLKSDFDIISACELNAGIFGIGSDYILSIKLSDLNGKEIKNIFAGDMRYIKDCEVVLEGIKVNRDNYPGCSKIEGFASLMNTTYRLDVIAGANQAGRGLNNE